MPRLSSSQPWRSGPPSSQMASTMDSAASSADVVMASAPLRASRPAGRARGRARRPSPREAGPNPASMSVSMGPGMISTTRERADLGPQSLAQGGDGRLGRPVGGVEGHGGEDRGRGHVAHDTAAVLPQRRQGEPGHRQQPEDVRRRTSGATDRGRRARWAGYSPSTPALFTSTRRSLGHLEPGRLGDVQPLDPNPALAGKVPPSSGLRIVATTSKPRRARARRRLDRFPGSRR